MSVADSPKVIKDSSIRRRRGTAGMMDYDIAPSWLVRVSFFLSLSLSPPREYEARASGYPGLVVN